MKRILLGWLAVMLGAASAFAARGDGKDSKIAGSKKKEKGAIAAKSDNVKETSALESSASATVVPSAGASALRLKAANQSDQDDQSPLFFKIGGAEFSPLGFMDFTTVYRSTDVGSGIGTSFGSIPFNASSPAGRLSELRFSAQNSRVGPAGADKSNPAAARSAHLGMAFCQPAL